MQNSDTLKQEAFGKAETARPRRIFRSIGAVLAGFVAIVVLSIGTDILLHEMGIYPPWSQPVSSALLLVATAYRAVYGIAGGYITARLAPNRPVRHALVLGVIGLVVSIVGLIATRNGGPEFGPRWYPITLVLIAIPISWLGGKIRGSQVRTRG